MVLKGLFTFFVLLQIFCHPSNSAMISKMVKMPEYDAMLEKMQIKSMGMPDPKVGKFEIN
jgi:hypothetical protein